MHLPQPGTPEFEKLILGHQKKVGGNLLGAMGLDPGIFNPSPAHQSSAGSWATGPLTNSTAPTAGQIIKQVKETLAKFPPPPKHWLEEFKVPYFLGQPLSFSGVAFKPYALPLPPMIPGSLLSALGPPQLDCTDQQAVEAAAGYDWCARDAALTRMAVRICGERPSTT